MAVAAADYTSGTQATATGHVLSKPANVANGDVLIASISFNANAASSCTPPSGWVAVYKQDYTEPSVSAALYIYSKVITDAGSEPSTYTFTFNLSRNGDWGVQRFTGVDASSLWDVAKKTVADPTSMTNATSVVPSVTTATNGAMAISAVSANSASQSVTGTPSGWTADINRTGGQCLVFAYKAMPTAGATGTATFTFNSAVNGSQGWVRALKPVLVTNDFKRWNGSAWVEAVIKHGASWDVVSLNSL